MLYTQHSWDAHPCDVTEALKVPSWPKAVWMAHQMAPSNGEPCLLMSTAVAAAAQEAAAGLQGSCMDTGGLMHLSPFPACRLGLYHCLSYATCVGVTVIRTHASPMQCRNLTQRVDLLNLMDRLETPSGDSTEKHTCPKHAVHIGHLCQA